MFQQEALADTDRFRRDFHQFIIGNEFNCGFQRELDGWCQSDRLISTGCADVGQLLAFDRLDHQIIVAAVDADDRIVERRELGEASPFSAEISTPFLRGGISGRMGANSSNT